MSSTPISVTSSAAPNDGDAADLDTALAALRGSGPRPSTTARHPRSSCRALLGVVLCALLLGGVFAVATSDPQPRPGAAGDNPSDGVYLSAHPGSCLAWQPDQPDRPSFVQCTTPHLFEVAQAIDSGGNEPCDLAVRRYLGDRFDPNSKFTIGELSATGSRRMLCGLQLPGPDGHLIPFRGAVAGTDQSKVWPPGTCLGIDPQTSVATDTVTDCAGPHAAEVIGAVDLGAQFHGAVPTDADQSTELREACDHLAAAYLAPRTVASTGLAVRYHAINPTSWGAGSRQAVCSVGPRTTGPITGPAKSHHPIVDESDSAPAESAPRTEGLHGHQIESDSLPAVTHSQQPSETSTAPATSSPTAGGAESPSAVGGPAIVSQVPGGAPAHEVIQIPGLAPVTVPAMPEDPGNAPVPLAP